MKSYINSVSINLIILPFSRINVSIRKLHQTLTFFHVISKRPFVKVFILLNLNTITIFEFKLILFVAIFKPVSTIKNIIFCILLFLRLKVPQYIVLSLIKLRYLESKECFIFFNLKLFNLWEVNVKNFLQKFVDFECFLCKFLLIFLDFRRMWEYRFVDKLKIKSIMWRIKIFFVMILIDEIVVIFVWFLCKLMRIFIHLFFFNFFLGRLLRLRDFFVDIYFVKTFYVLIMIFSLVCGRFMYWVLFSI